MQDLILRVAEMEKLGERDGVYSRGRIGNRFRPDYNISKWLDSLSLNMETDLEETGKNWMKSSTLDVKIDEFHIAQEAAPTQLEKELGRSTGKHLELGLDHKIKRQAYPGHMYVATSLLCRK